MNIIKILITLFLANPVYATNQYTITDVEDHNTANSCWVVYDNSVYDITPYLPSHDGYLNIRQWCGTDMTLDFETKAGTGEDHKGSSYQLLEQYYIGDLVLAKESQQQVDDVVTNTDTVIEQNTQEVSDTTIPSTSPYNLILPLVLTLIAYWIPYFFIKNKKKFNAFWNTILLLTLLIPSFGFGVFMMLRYQFPSLYNINFKFMYWHVELSVVMGVLGLSHLIQRLKIYLVQLKK